MSQTRIYLDNNASTLLDVQVANLIVETLSKLQGNPSSQHHYGQGMRGMISKARNSIAAQLHVKPSELVFTSGGTESVNMALQGLVLEKAPVHIITSAVEHACVLEMCKRLERNGHTITYLPVGSWGAVQPNEVKAAIRSNTKLIALMAANNETGVKTDIEAIANIALEHRLPFFVDGVSFLGKERFKIPLGVSAMAFSGHKIHALHGIGLLYLRTGVKFQPLIVGGDQEHGRRAGTENVLGILSLAKAVELISDESIEGMRKLRDKFEEILLEKIPDVLVNGDGPRIANTSNLSFPNVDGETLLLKLDQEGIAVSHGSACSSGSLEPSRVLLSMGLPMNRVNSSLRFSLSRETTLSEIEEACAIIIKKLY